MNGLSPEAQKVQNALDEFGIDLEVLELPDSTRTAEDAARAIGCQIGQISKSLIFEDVNAGTPVLIIASGPNRINETGVGQKIGKTIKLASPAFVLEHAGFPVGGVPPVGHTTKISTYVDSDLEQFDEIWAAAGTSHAVFRLSPKELLKITGGALVQVQ